MAGEIEKGRPHLRELALRVLHAVSLLELRAILGQLPACERISDRPGFFLNAFVRLAMWLRYEDKESLDWLRGFIKPGRFSYKSRALMALANRGTYENPEHFPQAILDAADAYTAYKFAEITDSAALEPVSWGTVRGFDTYTSVDPIDPVLIRAVDGVKRSNFCLLGLTEHPDDTVHYLTTLAIGVRVGLIDIHGYHDLENTPGLDTDKINHLVILPLDPLILRVFINRPIEGLSPDIRERVAKARHETYRATQAASGQEDIGPWENLSETLKKSNYDGADYVPTLLREIDYRLQKCPEETGCEMVFTDGEIELMAELEHARWTVDRFLDGWKVGQVKDREKKISPWLVPWDKLTDEIKQYDRDQVRMLPQILASAGYMTVKL